MAAKLSGKTVAAETVARFARHLEAQAGRYAPDPVAERLRVRPVRQSVRPNSQLYEFEIGTQASAYRVIVKVPFAPHHVTGHGHHGHPPQLDRPRLFPKADPSVKGLYEYRALVAIHTHFRDLSDARFGAIRVLDLLPEPYTLVMQKGTDPGFGRLARKAHRFCSRADWKRLQAGFRHAGAWLREMHRLPPLEHTRRRNTRADDYLAACDRFMAFLKRRDGRRGFFDRFQRELSEVATAMLPETLPLGTSHGDYAPRNLLLDAGGRVTVFDTLARWQAPIYEDLANFLSAFRTSLPQMLTPRLLGAPPGMAGCEDAFLQAYFERSEVPRGIVRLFECQLLLERWAALVFRAEQARGVRGVVKHCRVRLFNRFATRYLYDALRQAEREADRYALPCQPLSLSPSSIA